jgi:UDP-glucose 4-epimerase
MKILFTGGSSFTGFWIIRELVASGHTVAALFRHQPQDYSDEIRRKRVMLTSKICRPIYGCSFGDSSFLSVIREGGWELFCHHAADVTQYKSPDFDTIGAVRNNTYNLAAVLQTLRSIGCGRVLLTGSVFEGGEGSGSQGLPVFSPYGLSKALTAEMFRYYCDCTQLSLGKFVIPNPFGPYEEARFTAYLMNAWLNEETPICSSPMYIRDNIHVSLLAKCYVQFAENLAETPGFTRINPAGYVESQGAFTFRMAQEMRSRLPVPCLVELKQQTEFPEPCVRINTDVLNVNELGWNESAAWDDLAIYYQRLHG